MSSRPASVSPATAPARIWEPPGGLLVWLIVGLELFTFCVGLVAFIVHRNAAPAVFHQAQLALNQAIALANTAILLTGGWCMANGVAQLRAGLAGPARRWVVGAGFTALAFLGLKIVEYADKIRHGHGLHADSFFTFYWLLTGFHFLHVVAAMVLLFCMAAGIRRGCYTAATHADVEGSAVFWHLCDLVWLLIYPVVYLLP